MNKGQEKNNGRNDVMKNKKDKTDEDLCEVGGVGHREVGRGAQDEGRVGAGPGAQVKSDTVEARLVVARRRLWD
jgi:hypothetical protein